MPSTRRLGSRHLVQGSPTPTSPGPTFATGKNYHVSRPQSSLWRRQTPSPRGASPLLPDAIRSPRVFQTPGAISSSVLQPQVTRHTPPSRTRVFTTSGAISPQGFPQPAVTRHDSRGKGRVSTTPDHFCTTDARQPSVTRHPSPAEAPTPKWVPDPQPPLRSNRSPARVDQTPFWLPSSGDSSSTRLRMLRDFLADRPYAHQIIHEADGTRTISPSVVPATGFMRRITKKPTRTIATQTDPWVEQRVTYPRSISVSPQSWESRQLH